MKPNELLRHLRKLLALNENGMAEILTLGQWDADSEAVKHWLKQENEAGYQPCPERVPAHFLEGLIISRRGQKEGAPTPAPEQPLSNNQVLKKLRIAFELQGEDMHNLFAEGGQTLTKQALDALFRTPEHRNYQACSDQSLRRFLQALTERFRPH